MYWVFEVQKNKDMDPVAAVILILQLGIQSHDFVGL